MKRSLESICLLSSISLAILGPLPASCFAAMPILKAAAVKPLPKRDTADGTLRFADEPSFVPNLTPKEVLQLGSFGGGYFRRIKSSVTGKTHQDEWKEYPQDWFEGIDIDKLVTSEVYLLKSNRCCTCRNTLSEGS